MQIDFHHAATYVLARLAGMSAERAAVVAHAAQYVDDATNDGPLVFESGERYVRVTSAHKTLDPENADVADNRLVWVPFHFLPGNQLPAGRWSPQEAFVRRMTCKPGSEVAYAMVDDCIEDQDRPFSLHRFGIALHTFVDTWAHQQFAGIVDDFNKVDEIEVVPDPAYVRSPAYAQLTSVLTDIQQLFATHLPVGHAGVLTYPDLPFLKWNFIRSNGELVQRDNPQDYMQAAAALYNAVRRYEARDAGLADQALPEADAALIQDLLCHTVLVRGEDRHKVWLKAIAQGRFSFGAETVSYAEEGPRSWKFAALGEDPGDEEGGELFTYEAERFLHSHWKHFHDAVQYHRLFVLHELLPRFGLCAS